MGFLAKIKSFFSKNNNIGIINIGDLIQIPGRDYFKDSPDELEKIDKFKEKYLNILSQRKKVLTKEITNDDLNIKKNMYMDLILKTIVREEPLAVETQSRLDNSVILLKLKIYLEKIVSIENETIARLIALLELEKSRKVPHRNRDTLQNEIEQLKISLYIIFSQKISISKEIDNYLTHISISNDSYSPLEIEKRRDLTIRYANNILNVQDIFPKEELEDTNIFKQMSIIAFLETKMEEELRINKPNLDITNLTWGAELIGCTPDLNYRETKSIKDRLLHDLDELEEKWIVYYKFGKNLVQDEHWYRFYKAKFRILTFDIHENYDSILENLIFNSRNELERKTYEFIIQSKITSILCGENQLIKKIYESSDKESVVSIIKMLSTYLKDDEDRFLAYGEENYHQSMAALRLILAFDSKKDFIRFVNCKESTIALPDKPCFDELKNRIEYRRFEFNDMVPLYTILEVMGDKGAPLYYDCLRKIHTIFKDEFSKQYYISPDSKIWHKYHLPNSGYYFLPEGINRIIGSYAPISGFAKKVEGLADNKTVVMPSSLKSIEGDLFAWTSRGIHGVILNDGLRKIEYYSNIIPTHDVFDIPSSLEYSDFSGILVYKTRALRFNDYKNSKLLYNINYLCRLFSDDLACKMLNFKNNRTDQYKVRIDVDVQVIPQTLERVILEEDGKDIITISLNDIKCYGTLKEQQEKNSYYPNNDSLRLKFVKALIAKIKEEEKKLEDKPKVLKL